MASTNWKSSRIIKRNAHVDRIFIKEETRAHIKKVSAILKKAEAVRTEDEWRLLQQSEDVVRVIRKRTQVKEQTLQRHLEIEDSPDLLQGKCEKLASVIRNAMSLVVYTGAGISTAASIPDYRGPNGVWTLLKQGKQLRSMDLCDADATLTHMAIVELYKRGYVKHIVSQNCDGLHLRSGLPRSALSELHGNMYIEVCRECQPPVEYVRLFDVTERTAMRRHKTGRRCHKCNSALFDTIVHFGEKGANESPYNWRQAVEAADSADVILCLGSSLKVLKKYACLWGMHKSIAKRPHLFIVNLQWTPKDSVAALKINGRCDHVMHLVMKQLGIDIPSYFRSADPIFALAARLRTTEVKTTTKKMLTQLGSCSSAHCSQGHSEGKRGKDRRFKKRQLSSLPSRVMPPRRAKSSAQRTIRIAKKPLTSCAPASKDTENIDDCSGNCKSCSFVVPLTAMSDKTGTGATEFLNIEKSADRSLESSRKCFCGCICGCISSNSISQVQECIKQNIMGRPLEESDATVASLAMLSGCQVMAQRGFECGQLLRAMDRKFHLDRMIGNGTCWWDRIDSKTWLEALQAYLLHLSSGRMNMAEGNSYAAAVSRCHFTEASSYGADSWLSRDDLVGGSVSGQNVKKLFSEASKEPSSASVSGVQVSADQWKQLDSGEALRRLLEQNCKCECSGELLGVADSAEPVSEMPKQESPVQCSDEWLSGRPLKNPSNGGTDVLPCGRKLCRGTGYDEQALKLCTLSDLKSMHKVLFDPKRQSYDSAATRNVSEESGCSAAAVILPVENKQLNSANLELGMLGVNTNAKKLMANADLVRFMHSYCQQGMAAKREPLSPSEPTDMPLFSRSSSSYRVPESVVDSDQEIMHSNKGTEQIRTDQGIGQIRTDQGIEQIRTDKGIGQIRTDQGIEQIRTDKGIGQIRTDQGIEQIRTDQGIGQIRTDQVNGNSQAVTGLRSFHAEGSYLDTVQCLHGCIAQQKQYSACMSSASFDSVSKHVGSCDNLFTAVGLDSCQHVAKSSCLTQSPENCCHMSSRNANADSHVKEQKGKQNFISTPGWFGKGISLRKPKRKSLK